MVPIGFVSDHMEVVWDLDVAAADDQNRAIRTAHFLDRAVAREGVRALQRAFDPLLARIRRLIA